jgi:hypothetical protein
MNLVNFTMNSLFKQLGLGHSDLAVREFLHTASQLCTENPLHTSLIWNQAQADFLQQAIAEDSEWCALVEQLDACIRQGHEMRP